jgi:hypothetical protein
MRTSAARPEPEHLTPVEEDTRGVSALLGLALLHRTPAPRSARAEATAGSARFPCKSAVSEFTHPTGVDARAPVLERPRIVAAQDVVGDAENIEAGRCVEVDHRCE